jgi:hypothetical protein
MRKARSPLKSKTPAGFAPAGVLEKSFRSIPAQRCRAYEYAKYYYSVNRKNEVIDARVLHGDKPFWNLE